MRALAGGACELLDCLCGFGVPNGDADDDDDGVTPALALAMMLLMAKRAGVAAPLVLVLALRVGSEILFSLSEDERSIEESAVNDIL